MKKTVFIISIIVTVFSLSSCGTYKIGGEPVTYHNDSKAFSIELPASNKDEWVIDEDTPDYILDLKDKKSNVNVQIQAVSKGKVERTATDLRAYRDYVVKDIINSGDKKIELSDEDISVPDFIKNKMSYSLKSKKGAAEIKGLLVFMESEKSYYTLMIRTSEKVYDGNEDALKKVVSSFKEM